MTQEDRWLEAWRQRQRLLGIARSRVPTREDAEDVVSEAITRAGTQEGLPVEAVPAWLTRVTINLCVDRQRRLATQRAALSRPELQPAVLPTHEDDVVARAEAAWLASKVEELPLRQALAVRLRADGVGSAETATLLAVSQAAVEGLLKRSRTSLRGTLRAAGALAACLWAALSQGRRPAVVLAASAAVLVALLPWTAEPLGPSPAPPVARPDVAQQIHAGAASEQTPVLAAPQARAAGPAQRDGGSRASRPGLGLPVAYDGPRCLALYCLPIVDEEADRTLGATSPRGWSPADLAHYLGEPAWSGDAAQRRPLVAVVGQDSFSWVLDDLAVYRRTFGLPACDTGSGCLHVVEASTQDTVQEEVIAPGVGAMHRSTSRLHARHHGNAGAAQAQLLQAVSAACPECRLTLVIAESDSVPDLAAAFRASQQVEPDVVVTSLDLRADPDRDLSPLEDPTLYEGALVVAGGGVSGFTAGLGGLPRRMPGVVSVGGSTISAGRVVAANGNVSFCNTTAAQPSWQRGSSTGCRGRAGVDLVLPGAVENGLSVYVSGGLPGGRGWYHHARDRQAAAILAGLLARHGLTDEVRSAGDLYAHPEWFADITTGSTDCADWGCATDPERPGQACPQSARQLCDARRGWDGASGLGEPRYLPWR